MLFNSFPFLILFFFTYLIYWNSKDSFKKYILILASLLFYGYFSLYSLAHFLLVIFINYYFSHQILKEKKAGATGRNYTYFIVLLNIANLCLFKYFYFFLESLHYLTGWQQFRQIAGSWHILLPLAISFYTFQLTAIQIDTYREKITQPIAFVDYFLFILFFPQLIAGPIMRSDDFFYQIDKLQVNLQKLEKGMLLILSGLFKKIIISDTIGGIIAPLYGQPTEYHFLPLFLGAIGFASQVYCDFSGYTDIARGLANLLGYDIPENFRGPFLSASFRELWSRWHITLSTWLRDYLYIPLGGSRLGEFRSNMNMLITMALGGLWHGADISFVNWGVYLGLLLWFERILEKHGIIAIETLGYKRIIRVGIVYLLFCFSGVFFRAGISGQDSFAITLNYFTGMFTLQSGKMLARMDELYLFIILTLVFNAFQYYEKSFSTKIISINRRMIPLYSLIMLLLLGIFGDGGGDFIYFQF